MVLPGAYPAADALGPLSDALRSIRVDVLAALASFRTEAAAYGIRLMVGSAMVLFICLGFAAIRRRDIARHSAWMMRCYALVLGTGTQALTHLPWFLFPGIQGELTRALLMGAGWIINLVVAEAVIRNRPILPARSSTLA